MDLDYYDVSSSNPVENKPLNNMYGLLCSLIEAFTPDIAKLNLKDGSGERLNSYIDELAGFANDEKLRDFKVEIRQDHKGVSWVSGEAYARQLVGIVNYLYKVNESVNYYCGGPPAVKFSKGGGGNGATINNHLNADQRQANEQTTSVSIEFTQTIVSLTEALTNLERDNPEKGSKENKFATALKKQLPTVKSTLDIIGLVLKIAGEVGLNPQAALKMLGLG